MAIARARRPLRIDELPSWMLARQIAHGPLAELARRWARESARLGEESEEAADFVAWVLGLDRHPPGRPRGSIDRHPDARRRRSRAQRARRERDRTRGLIDTAA